MLCHLLANDLDGNVSSLSLLVKSRTVIVVVDGEDGDGGSGCTNRELTVLSHSSSEHPPDSYC